METHFDDVVVGAGILGLAHAYHLARRGRRVAVFERSPRAVGASIRNFGMLWPIGQPAGKMYAMARRSLEIWTDVLRDSGIWHERTGSLHLAYREDEAQVLREFVEQAESHGYDCSLLGPREVLAHSLAVKPDGLIAGMWSANETCVDPREVVATLPSWLEETYGVEFAFGSAVNGIEAGRIFGGGREYSADHVYICTGDDTQTLYPQLLQNAGFTRCKLQMMRSHPYFGSWRLGPMLAAGLTLRHYGSFRNCPSLPALRKRVSQESPLIDRYDIHVMASQNGNGEIVIGDSHEYDGEIEPFDRQEIDALILGYLDSFLVAPDLRIASHWHGTYLKHPIEPYFVAHPEPGVSIVTGVGGAGMTLSFGLAEKVVNSILGVL